MNRTQRFLQDHYHDRRLQRDGLIAHLLKQSLQLIAVESTLEDPALLATTASEIDFDLLRYTCAALHARLTEAAHRDCAQLIADSVLDVSGDDQTSKQWQRWLDLAPVWPTLALANWRGAAAEAANIVIDRLEGGGVIVEQTAAEEIDRAVSELELVDLLPADLFATCFPVDGDDGEDG